MSNTLILNQSFPESGLYTYTYTVPTSGDGIYNVKCDCTVNPPSGISVVVNKNGSPVLTVSGLPPTQGAFQFRFPIYLVATDIVTVVPTSSSNIDNALNTVKMIVSIGQGQ
jgi:hypothetical protein